ncbi:MAG TPA: TetR/AcrR family transcriptional regulator [Gemmatimonadales bacterium]|nr:TetR/AcrR family transcriptional regulator [Gemmatimonadales bacterium]
MSSAERRLQERGTTRRQILDAARELFVASGYEAVSMRKIAERVGISPTAIYLHFRDKEALVRELCLTDFQSLADALRVIAAEPDPIERLRQIGYAYVEFGLAHPQHYRLLFMTPLPPPDPDVMAAVKGNPDRDGYELARAAVADAAAAGCFRPDLRDVEGITQLCWAAAHGMVSLWVVRQQDPWVEWRPVREAARALIDATLHGLVCTAERRR